MARQLCTIALRFLRVENRQTAPATEGVQMTRIGHAFPKNSTTAEINGKINICYRLHVVMRTISEFAIEGSWNRAKLSCFSYTICTRDVFEILATIFNVICYYREVLKIASKIPRYINNHYNIIIVSVCRHK